MKATGQTFWSCRACSTYAAGMNHRLREIGDKAQAAMDMAKESAKETAQLKERIEKDKDVTEKKVEKCELSVYEEMNLREEKRKNVVIYGLEEAVETEGWKRMEVDKRKLNELFTILDINVSVEMDVEFCRRVGERSDRARPLVVGFFTEWSKSVLLKNCRYLADSEMSHLSIANDLTEKQRRLEKDLVKEAERRNAEELTAEERTKNLEWRVVGKKGQKRLIKTYGQADRARGAVQRGATRGGFGRGARGAAAAPTTNLLPVAQRAANWEPVNAATSTRGARADSRKRNRSGEEDQQRKRGTGVRGRPPLRARAGRAGARSQQSSQAMENESGEEEEIEELPVSQVVMGQTRATEEEEMREETTGTEVNTVDSGMEGEEEAVGGIRVGKN